MAASSPWGFLIDPAALDQLPSTEWNKLAKAANLVFTQLADLFGAGIWATTDFNGTLVGGALSVNVSAGTAIIGNADARKVIQKTGVTLVTGLFASKTNDIYLLKSSEAFSVIRRGEDAVPAEAVLALSVVTDSTEGTSVDNNPSGRINFGRILTTEQDRDGSSSSPLVTSAAEASNARVVTIQVRDLGGANVAAERLVRVWISGTDKGAEVGTAPSGGVVVNTGTILQTITAGKHYLLVTNASGVAQITLSHTGAGTFYVMAEYAGRIGSANAIFT
jgi:hypothetical protein